MLLRTTRRCPLPALAFSLLVAAFMPSGSAARADYVSGSTLLNQSDYLPPLSSGYGNLTLSAYDGLGAPPPLSSGLSAGEVSLQFREFSGLYGPGSTPLINSIVFNTDLALSASQITAPAGWTVTGPVGTTFGIFSWSAYTDQPGNGLVSPSLLITGLGTDATLAHFQMLSTGSFPFPPAYFGAHIIGIVPSAQTSFQDNQWATAGAPVAPEPATLVLAGLGLAALAGRRVLRGNRTRATMPSRR
jgi:hypothetical protein